MRQWPELNKANSLTQLMVTIPVQLATTQFLSKFICRGRVVFLAVFFDVGLVAEAGSLPGGHVGGYGFLNLNVGF